MKFMRLMAAGAWLALAAGPALADTDLTVHLRGTIATMAAHTLTMQTRLGETVSVALPDAMPVMGATAGTLADIKPGSFVGSAAQPQPDGSLTALEVHVFPKSMAGTGAGSRPWDSEEGSTMTNGHVGSAEGVTGRVLKVMYPGGEKTITVPPDVPVVLTDKGTRALLKPGVKVVVTASRAADGALTAKWVVAGKNGVTPPM